MAKRFNYGKMQGTAARLLAHFKQGLVTLHRDVNGDPRPPDWPTWEAWPDNSRREVYELDAVVKGVSQKLIDGDVVLASDLEMTCSHKMALVEVNGESVTPAPVEFDADLLDTLAIDGKPVTIVRNLTVPAAGTQVAHKYAVRG